MIEITYMQAALLHPNYFQLQTNTLKYLLIKKETVIL